MTLEVDIRTLQETHVTRLQIAARLAGLRWKSGTPGYDKQGIIDKLAVHPSILNATLATIARMNRGEKVGGTAQKVGSNSLADDLRDEAQTEPVKTEVAQAIPGKPQTSEGFDATFMAETDSRLSKVEAEIKTLTFESREHAQHLKQHDYYIQSHEKTLLTFAKAIATLQERKPIQFTIEGKTYTPVSGQHKRFSRMVRWLSLRKIDRETRKGHRTHALLIGPASSGKTTAAIEYAKMLGLELYSQPLSMDSFGVLGYTSPDGKAIETEFTRAWCYGGVFLWDELSMSAPEAVGSLNSALANGFIAIPGKGVVYAHPDFYMIAGDNSDTGGTLKYGARALLDGASLDRFVRIEWEIDLDIEASLTGDDEANRAWLEAVRAIRAEIIRRDVAHVGATMRATITGCMALTSGVFSRAEILEDTCKKGLIAEEWHYYTALPAVQSFLRG